MMRFTFHHHATNVFYVSTDTQMFFMSFTETLYICFLSNSLKIHFHEENSKEINIKINVCKSVRDSFWFTLTFRSTFSAKTAYIFKIVDKPEHLDVWIDKPDKTFASDLYLIYKRSPSARVCISDKDWLQMFYLLHKITSIFSYELRQKCGFASVICVSVV